MAAAEPFPMGAVALADSARKCGSKNHSSHNFFAKETQARKPFYGKELAVGILTIAEASRRVAHNASRAVAASGSLPSK